MSQKSIDLSSKPLWTMSGHEDSIWNIAYLGGDQLVTCSFDKTIRVWNVENGNQEGTSMEHDGRVFGLAVTRDKKRILSGDENSSNRVKVWNVESHECIEEWGPTGSINCISMSPDDRLAASGYSNGKIVVREIKEDGEIKHSIQAGSWVTSLCFSPNGEKLASLVGEFEDDRAIYVTRVYDVESGKLILGPIKGHEDVVRCVIWSLDGSQLFSASDDYTVRCWSTETGEPIGQPWTGHTHNVTSLSLSPDGSKLASTSWDHTVRFWDARSGEPIGRPLQHDNWLWAVTFSPSGEFVASGGRDKKVSIWRVPWWDGIQKQAHESFLDLPAVPAPNDLSNDQAQHELDFFNPPATRRLITPTSQPFVHPANPPTSPTVTRVRRFWRGLVARSASSPAQQATELQSMHERRFWKAPAHIPVTEVAAGHMTDKVVVGRRERRRRKKEDKPQTHAASSAAGEGPSSSTSHASPSNSQIGPFTSSEDAAPTRRPTSFAQSDTGSDDSWDDMDCCGQCLDYFCVGPRANRERFRPWKKKSRAVFEAEERAREEKKRETAHRYPKNNPPRTQNRVRPSHRQISQPNHITPASPAPSNANEATLHRLGDRQLDGADVQRVILQLREENEQLRRQLAAKLETEAERVGLENVKELQSEPLSHTGSFLAETGPSSLHADSSGSTSNAAPSASEGGPSILLSGAPEGPLSSFAQPNSYSIQGRRAKAELEATLSL